MRKRIEMRKEPRSSKQVKSVSVATPGRIEDWIKVDYSIGTGGDIVVVAGAKELSKFMRGKITQVRGQLHGRVFPMLDPGIVRRDPSKISLFEADADQLRRLAYGEEFSIDSVPWSIVTPDNVDDFLADCEVNKLWSMDIETTGLDCRAGLINSLQVGTKSNNWALPLAIRKSPWSKRRRGAIMGILEDLSQGKKVTGHNFKFDNNWIFHHYGFRFHLDFDTMLAHHLLDENSPHSLKYLATRYLGAPSYDVDKKTKQGKGDLRTFYHYGCLDVYFTRKLRNLFRQRLLKAPELRRLFYKLVMPAAREFEKIDYGGQFIDTNRLRNIRRQLRAQREELLEELNSIKEINWDSPKQVADLLFNQLGISPLDRTAKGAPSTSESVMMRLNHPAAKKLVEYRGVQKNLSTYVEGWRDLMHGDRLYLSTKLHGTVTGRYSSRLHQVPRDVRIRSLIGAPEGYVFVCADYSQIELRIAALLSGDLQLRQAYLTGADVHRLTASRVLGKSPEDITKEERKMAKAVNFGLIYGMRAPKLVVYARDDYGVDMSLPEAKKFRKIFFEMYSSILPWHERQRRCVRMLGQVTSLSGRIRRLPGIHSSEPGVRAEAERQSVNAPVQGFGSGDLKAMAIVEIAETFDPEVIQVKGEVHDSVLMWCREDSLHELKRVKQIMESPRLLEGFQIDMAIPLVVDVEVGKHWGETDEFDVLSA